MKHRPIVYFLLFMKYIVIMLLWYWLFVDSLWIRLTSSLLLISYSILNLLRPDLFPVRINFIGKEYPVYVALKIQKFLSWVGMPIGILVLLGYRINTAKHLGIVGLVFFGMMTVFYLLWIKNSDQKERSETKRFWIFALVALAMFLIMSIIIILKGSHEIIVLTKYSPYPIMTLYFLLGIVHLIVVFIRGRHYV